MWNLFQVPLLFPSGLFTVTVKIMSLSLAVFLAFFYFVCIKCIYSRHQRDFLKSLKRVINVSLTNERKGADIKALVVTAHPDDECMFFAPAIIQLVALNANVHLLCLSQGMATEFSPAHSFSCEINCQNVVSCSDILHPVLRVKGHNSLYFNFPLISSSVSFSITYR